MEIGKDLGGAGRPLSEGSPYPPNLPDPPRTSPMTPPFWKRRFVSLFVSGGIMGEVFVFWKVVFCKVRLSRLFCGWEAFGYNALRECRTPIAHKSGAKPRHVKNLHLPPEPKTSPGSTRPIQSESNLHSAWAGALGGSSGKFWEGQGGLEGRKPSTKEGFLRLQGLPVFLPHAAKASTNERNSARSEWRSRSRPRNFARTVA